MIEGDFMSANRELTGGKGKVLLVEDDETFLRFVGRVLSEQGYDVVEAVNGRKALDLLTTHGETFRFVVCDMMMPEVGGASLSREICAKYPGLDIIFMSGYVDNVEELTKILKADAIFLRKPFSLDDLLDAVEKVAK